MQLVIGRHAVKALDDIQAAEIGLYGDLLTARELTGNRHLATEEGFACPHVPVNFHCHRGNALEVLRIRRDDDVHVLCTADYSPSS